jgi:hypothetical protein
MQPLHRVAEQGFRMQFAGAVGGEQEVQIDGERRVGQALSARDVARRQAFVTPAAVGADTMQEKIEA